MPVATIRSQPRLLQPEEINIPPGVDCGYRKHRKQLKAGSSSGSGGNHRQQSRRRKVTFKQVVAVRPIKHVDNMTDDELDDIWFNRDDFDTFKMSFVRTVKLLSSGAFKGDDENHCARGLEGRTREGAFQRKSNKYHGRQAVLFEQERQRSLGINEDKLISEAYVVENLRCRLTALEMGIKDQNEVFEELSQIKDELSQINECSMEDLDFEDSFTEATEELTSSDEDSSSDADEEDLDPEDNVSATITEEKVEPSLTDEEECSSSDEEEGSSSDEEECSSDEEECSSDEEDLGQGDDTNDDASEMSQENNIITEEDEESVEQPQERDTTHT